MKSLIICSGSICNSSLALDIIKKCDYIICADGGTRHAYDLDIIPNIIIGDLDSCNDFYINFFCDKKVEFRKYPKDKDKTDTQLCVEYALEFCDEIVLLAATGNRIDHVLGNISLLKLGLENNKLITIIDDNNEIYMVDKEIILRGQKGDIISLIPMSDRVEGISVSKAQYELSDAVMELGNPYGISNLFIDNEVRVNVKKGYLLVIKSKD